MKGFQKYVSVTSHLPAKWSRKVAVKIPSLYKCFINAENRLRYFFYKNRILRFYADFISKGDLCFDIGANIGSKIKIFLDLGARVVAVEPQSYCMRQLQKQYGNNNRVILVNMACAESDGETELMLCNNYRSSSISKEWINIMKKSHRCSAFNWRNSEKVSVTTLDDLIKKYGKPTFCKIDIEGAEFRAIKGLSKPIRHVSFEFNRECIDIAINCMQYLFGIGIRQFNYSPKETMRLASSSWYNYEEIQKIILSLPDDIFFGEIYARYDG